MCIFAIGFTFSDADIQTVEIPVNIGEDVSVFAPAVYEYAAEIATKRAEELATSDVTVQEATITDIEYIPTGLTALVHSIDTYRVSYELSVYGEKPSGVDATVNEAGFIIEQTSKGDTYFILLDADSLVGVGGIDMLITELPNLPQRIRKRF